MDDNDWLLNIEHPGNPWIKLYLVMMYFTYMYIWCMYISHTHIYLLMFCWGFLHLCHEGYLSVVFFSCTVPLPPPPRVMLVSENKLGSISLTFWKGLCGISDIFSFNIWQNSLVETSGSEISFSEDFKLQIQFLYLGHFRLSISSCRSSGSLWFLSNGYFSSKLSNLCGYSCL